MSLYIISHLTFFPYTSKISTIIGLAVPHLIYPYRCFLYLNKTHISLFPLIFPPLLNSDLQAIFQEFDLTETKFSISAKHLQKIFFYKSTTKYYVTEKYKIDVQTNKHKIYNFKILGLSRFHQYLEHPVDLSNKDFESRTATLYIMWAACVNFKSNIIKDFSFPER